MPLYQIEAKLGGELLESLAKEVSTPTLKVEFFDADNITTQIKRTPDPNTRLFEMDPLNTTGKKSEYLLCDSHSTTDGVTTLVNVTRGLPRDPTFPLVAVLANANSWDAGAPIGSATQHYNDNLTGSYFDGTQPVPGNMTFDGDITFNGINDFNGELNVPIYADATARDAAIPSPREGSIIKNTAVGLLQKFVGGVWVDDTAGTIPDATNTSSGKVELVTATEANNAADTGTVGPNVMIPSETARVIQDNRYEYAVDSGVADAYVVTLIPAPTAYFEGQEFIWKATNANTGASTINFNALGVKSLVKNVSDPLVAGDILANQILKSVYDGTNFVTNLFPAALTDGGNADAFHTHDPIALQANSGRINIEDDFDVTGLTNTGEVITNTGTGWAKFRTGTTINSTAFSNNSMSGWATSIHDKNPDYYVIANFSDITSQNAFMGIGNTTGLSANALVTDHAAFLVSGGTMIASVGDGTTQNTSGTLTVTLTNNNAYRIKRVGADYLFYINDMVTPVATLTANIPDSNLSLAPIIYLENLVGAQREIFATNHKLSFDL